MSAHWFCWLDNSMTVERWWREVAGKHPSTEWDTFITHLMIFLHNTTTNNHSLKQTHSTARDARVSTQWKRTSTVLRLIPGQVDESVSCLRDTRTKQCGSICEKNSVKNPVGFQAVWKLCLRIVISAFARWSLTFAFWPIIFSVPHSQT